MDDDESNERSWPSNMSEEEWKRRSELGVESTGMGYISKFFIRRKRRRMTDDGENRDEDGRDE